ncbi:hypothetical protein G7A66_01505 [Altererythrobacter sp. SALINAS58]|uniref:hypothetical protein n=1 Tax=Alteripontixanthobacter muriae TaxID=2705546 RepID=UPI0015761B50|nr:hypothetical protein [Alteripontixanthobacter muriae]NTZ41783.1 hypothetical protein [Alteripontixanthobacter muriae]
MTVGSHYPEKLPPIELRDRLLERLESDVEPELELAELQRKLAQATQRMESVGDGGRYGLALAMRALEEYFSRLGFPLAVLYPINSVMAATQDARCGIESPIFKPDRAGKVGAPSSSVLRLEANGYIAVIVECCVQHCRLEKMRPYLLPGCQLAAKLLRESKWSSQGTALELRKLRERVQEADADNPAKVLYREMLDSDIAREHPLAWARDLASHDWIIQFPSSDLLDE